MSDKNPVLKNSIALEVYSRIPIVLFFVFAGVFVLAKGPLFYSLSMEQNVLSFGEQGFWLDYKTWGYIPNYLFPRLRIVGSVLGNGIEWFYTMAASILFWDVSRSVFDAFTPWPGGDRVFQNIHTATVPIASYITYGIVCLFPVYWLTKRLYDSVIFRSAFIVLALVSMFGWHPTIVNIFFNIASLFADWPRAYYLYSGILQMQYSDLAGIGVTAIIIIYLSGHSQSKVTIVMMAILAQLTMEPLGLVLVVGLFFSHLFSDAANTFPERLKGALVKVFVASGTIIVMAVLILILVYFIIPLQNDAESVSWTTTERQWLINNFQWIKSIFANIVTLTLIPLFMGSLVGAAAAWTSDGVDGERLKKVRRQAISGASVTAGLWAVAAVGMFFTPYPSDMAREFVAISLSASVAGAKGAEFLYFLAANRLARRSGGHHV